MHIRPFQAIFPNLDYITSTDSFFDTVKEEYGDYSAGGFFNKAAQEALYIYQIQKKDRQHTGIIACVDIQDFKAGKIKKHEGTIASKEQKQIQLLLKRKAAVKPILLAYPKVNEILSFIHEYTTQHEVFMEVGFEESEEKHFFWEVRDGQKIRDLQLIFEQKVPVSYIADGHHRTTTTAIMHERMKSKGEAEKYELLLCGFFSSHELDILDFNRVVDALDECSPTYFMARISQLFEIEVLEKPEKPRKKHEITLYIEREWYRLTWREQVLKAYQKEEVILDSMLLNELVLKNIFGIEDVRNDLRIKYVEGPKGLKEIKKRAVKSGSSVGFCLYPVQFSELISLADEGKMLPPKSTWFEPRMKNGLMIMGY